MRSELERVRDWAKGKLHAYSEPPWARYQYMKLVETVTAILDGMDATRGNSLQSEPPPGTHLRLVDSTNRSDTAPPRPDQPKPRLPM